LTRRSIESWIEIVSDIGQFPDKMEEKAAPAAPPTSARRATDASDYDHPGQASTPFPSSFLTNYTCPNLKWDTTSNL